MRFGPVAPLGRGHAGDRRAGGPFLHFAAALQAYTGACGAAGRRPRAPGAARRWGSRMQCEWVPCVGSPCNGALSSRVSQKNCIVKKVAVMDHKLLIGYAYGCRRRRVTGDALLPGTRIPDPGQKKNGRKKCQTRSRPRSKALICYRPTRTAFIQADGSSLVRPTTCWLWHGPSW